MEQQGFSCGGVNVRVEKGVGGVVSDVAQGVGEGEIVSGGKAFENAKRIVAALAVEIGTQIASTRANEFIEKAKICALCAVKIDGKVWFYTVLKRRR